jgi:hypothetical protein
MLRLDGYFMDMLVFRVVVGSLARDLVLEKLQYHFIATGIHVMSRGRKLYHV